MDVTVWVFRVYAPWGIRIVSTQIDGERVDTDSAYHAGQEIARLVRRKSELSIDVRLACAYSRFRFGVDEPAFPCRDLLPEQQEEFWEGYHSE